MLATRNSQLATFADENVYKITEKPLASIGEEPIVREIAMEGVNSNLNAGVSGLTRQTSLDRSTSSEKTSSDFSETFGKYLDEVNQLQQEASQSVQSVVTGQSDDLTGVMTAMQKSDVAFKTLLAIRTKLLDAYNELKNMPI